MSQAHDCSRSSRRARRPRCFTLALFIVLLSLSPVLAFSADTTSAGVKIPSVKLKKVDKAVFWTGTVSLEDAPNGGTPFPCNQVTYDHAQIEIALPANTFSDPNRPGGVQVALRWTDEFNTLNLYVYKDGAFRGSSAGVIATAQSLLLPNPENGIYDVWVASDPGYNVDTTVAYEGLAEVEFAPAISPARRLLPDLVVRPARTLTFDTPSFPLFEPDPPPGSSCFDSETLEDGARNCLRFDQVIANVGQAPLELRFAVPRDLDDQSTNVLQRVYWSNGLYIDQFAGNWEFHGSHHHYHYTSFAIAYLFNSNRVGEKIGFDPVRTSEKVSFCIVDIEIDAWGRKGDGVRSYFAPNCLEFQEGNAQYQYLVQGLTNGWSDVYEWYLPDQYMEVSNVPDGYYVMEFCADPDNAIEELDETNNCTYTHIHVEQVGTPQQRVINLGPLTF
jgi:lysyl oxidase